MTLARAYLSGSVRRWHMNPAMAHTDQSDADHQGRCVLLACLLHPAPSAGLLRCLATHDAGEMDAGDLSWQFKQTQQAIAANHAAFEADARQRLCGQDPILSPTERLWVRLIDRLESACWCLHRNPAEYHRAGSGWDKAEADILARAGELGCRDAVHGLLWDLKGGRW